MSSERYTSIEFLKGLGIIYLIALHEWVWLWLDLDRMEYRYAQIVEAFPYYGYYGLPQLGLGVPCLAGITFYIAMVRKQSRFGPVVKRALGLIFLGYMINFLCWGVFGTAVWDVLQFIGLAMLISFPLIKGVPGLGGLLIALALGGGALLLSDQYPVQEMADSYLYIIAIGSSSGEHYWPLCPWYFTFAAGMLMGYVLESRHDFRYHLLLGAGAVCVLLALVTDVYVPVMTINLWGADMFKPAPLHVLGIVGTMMVWIGALEILWRSKPNIKQLCERSFVVTLGRSILWLFLLNTIVGYHVTRLVLKSFTLTFPQALAVYVGLVAGTLLVGYGIAFVIGQRKRVIYA